MPSSTKLKSTNSGKIKCQKLNVSWIDASKKRKILNKPHGIMSNKFDYVRLICIIKAGPLQFTLVRTRCARVKEHRYSVNMYFKLDCCRCKQMS